MMEADLHTNQELKFTYHNFLAVYLITEIYKKKEDADYRSPHQDYIDNMPGDCKDFPVFYTEEELAMLEGTSMIG